MGGFILGFIIGCFVISAFYGLGVWVLCRKIANHLHDKPEIRLDLQQVLVGAFKSPPPEPEEEEEHEPAARE